MGGDQGPRYAGLGASGAFHGPQPGAFWQIGLSIIGACQVPSLASFLLHSNTKIKISNNNQNWIYYQFSGFFAFGSGIRWGSKNYIILPIQLVLVILPCSNHPFGILISGSGISLGAVSSQSENQTKWSRNNSSSQRFPIRLS